MEETIDRLVSHWSVADDLTRGAARLLEAGEFSAAFRMADRLCRTASPDARVLLLRAKTLKALQKETAASRDLKEAFALDPTDPQIAYHVLSSSLADLQTSAAKALIRSPHASFKSIRLALKTLFSGHLDVVANLRFVEGKVGGWVAWTDMQPPRMTLRAATQVIDMPFIEPTPDHPLTDKGWTVATVALALPEDADSTLGFLAADQTVLSAFAHIRTLPARVPLRSSRTPPIAGSPLPRCSVIVPIYDDLETTALCLDALAHQNAKAAQFRVILINDHPGDAAMLALTREAAAAYGFEVIENATNLGFVGSINRALATVQGGDVLLLNADAILPPGAIERLRTAAHSKRDIGTVTPLSNNGELTSLPRPFDNNPLGSPSEIDAFDAIAEQVNRGQTVTLPCGIGFCLYIRADCFAAVGALSDIYLRGYHEDAEFCLRAREAGFRNVCATDVYVGHMGTRSFKDEKRGLVVRNLKVLETRFPSIADDTLAFVQTDPLLGARMAIEGRAVKAAPRRRLIIARRGDEAMVRRRIENLEAKGVSVLTLTGPPVDNPCHMTLRQEGYGAPQASTFDVTQLKDNSILTAMLHRLGVTQVDVFSNCAVPNSLAGLLAVGDFKLRTVVDACPFETPTRIMPRRCEAEQGSFPCDECRAAFVPLRSTAQSNSPFDFNAMTSRKGPRPRALSGMAEALFRRLNIPAVTDRIGRRADDRPQQSLASDQIVPPAAVDRDGLSESILRSTRPDVGPQQALPSQKSWQTAAIGILSPMPTASSERLLRLLAGSPGRIGAGRPLVVFGRALDDLSLSSFPDVSITGQVDPKDYAELFGFYDIGLVFAPERWGGFYLVGELAQETGLPHAYFDWSFGTLARAPANLALDPRICDTKAARLVLDWAPFGEGTLGERG